MANTFKLKTKANVGTATSDLYVVPSATTTVVIGVTLANTTGSSINVGVGVTRASSDDVKVNGVSIQASALADATALAIALG